MTDTAPTPAPTPMPDAAPIDLPIVSRRDRKIAQLESRLTELSARVDTMTLQPGPRGERGERGLTGGSGPRGLLGDTGPRGERGESGPRGEAGERSLPGERGPRGERGERGGIGPTPPPLPGPRGEQGERGVVGQRGKPGPQGLPGDIGPRGEAVVPRIATRTVTRHIATFPQRPTPIDILWPAAQGGGFPNPRYTIIPSLIEQSGALDATLHVGNISAVGCTVTITPSSEFSGPATLMVIAVSLDPRQPDVLPSPAIAPQ